MINKLAQLVGVGEIFLLPLRLHPHGERQISLTPTRSVSKLYYQIFAYPNNLCATKSAKKFKSPKGKFQYLVCLEISKHLKAN